MAKLTAKQEKFVDGVVSGLSYADAFRQAGYSINKYDAQGIAREAKRVADNPKIRPIIEQRRKELADKAIWTREQSLQMLVEIAVQAKKNTHEEVGENTRFNSQAQQVAIKAIEQANKMCGYNEPDKVEHSGGLTIQLADDLADWGK